MKPYGFCVLGVVFGWVVLALGCAPAVKEQVSVSCADRVWKVADGKTNHHQRALALREYLKNCLGRPIPMEEALSARDLNLLVGLSEVHIENFAAWSGPRPIGNVLLENQSAAAGTDQFDDDEEIRRVLTFKTFPQNPQIDADGVVFQLILDKPVDEELIDNVKQSIVDGELNEYWIVGWGVSYFVADKSISVMYEGEALTAAQVEAMNPGNTAEGTSQKDAKSKVANTPGK